MSDNLETTLLSTCGPRAVGFDCHLFDRHAAARTWLLQSRYGDFTLGERQGVDISESGAEINSGLENLEHQATSLLRDFNSSRPKLMRQISPTPIGDFRPN